MDIMRHGLPSILAAAYLGTVVGSMTGTVYAYSSASGQAIWQFDTARAFETVNGAEARGGNINAAGPVVAGGMVFVVRLFGSRWRRA